MAPYRHIPAAASEQHDMKNGRISVHGPVESLKNDPKVVAAYLGGGHAH